VRAHICVEPRELLIAKFTSIINDLNKIDIKIKNEDQALLLLCSLSSSYKSFREAIYRCKSTVNVNEVKKYLLNKDKIDKKLMENLIVMILDKFSLQKRKVIIEVLRVIQNIRIWCATGVTKGAY